MSNNKDEEKKEFTIEQQNDAYIELCNYIRLAIENGDFASLEPLIALWESKYPLDKFTDPEIIRKIKAILNKDYLSRLIGDYLASQVLHEQQKLQEYYENLRNIINTAKTQNTVRGYENAKKEVAKWKTSLYENGYSISDFNRKMSIKIFAMLLMPSEKLTEINEASNFLKKLFKDSTTMGSEELSSKISDWQEKYSVNEFPKDMQLELNNIAGELLQSIAKKKNEETAIQEMKDYLETVESESKTSPAEEVPKLLAKYDYSSFSEDAKSQIALLTTEAMSLTELALETKEPELENSIILGYIPPVQQAAIYDLKNIFDKNINDINGLFNWIYLNRKIDFVPEAVDNIKELFRRAGYPIPKNGKYELPSLPETVTMENVTDIMELTVLNYIGLLYTRTNSLSSKEQDKIAKTYSKKELIDEAKTIVIPVLDNSDKTITTNSIEDLPPYTTNLSDDLKEQETIVSSNGTGNQSEPVDNEIVLIIDKLLEDPTATTYELTPHDEVQEVQKNSSSTENKTIKQVPENKTEDSIDNSFSATNTLEYSDPVHLEENQLVPYVTDTTNSSIENEGITLYESNDTPQVEDSKVFDLEESNNYTPILTPEDQKTLGDINYVISNYVMSQYLEENEKEEIKISKESTSYTVVDCSKLGPLLGKAREGRRDKD